MRSFLSILQLKIAGGYILLLALLCAVVFLVQGTFDQYEKEGRQPDL